jgi:hypothetical protein
MTLNDYLVLFGLLIVLFGIGLLLYVQVLGLILRFHLILFPKIHSKILQLENQESSAK